MKMSNQANVGKFQTVTMTTTPSTVMPRLVSNMMGTVTAKKVSFPLWLSKGVKNDAAGKFANKVHKASDGAHVVYINHPKEHPDHWSHHPEDHEEHYREHPEKFTRPHHDPSKRPSPFHIVK